MFFMLYVRLLCLILNRLFSTLYRCEGWFFYAFKNAYLYFFLSIMTENDKLLDIV